MSIWFQRPSLDVMSRLQQDTLISQLGMEMTEVGDDFLRGKMPVDARTWQPYRMLHGGASVALAETLGSIAANFCIDHTKQQALGLDINANHLRAVRTGWVIGTARPLHLGRSTQVWQIEIDNENGQPVCVARLTMAIRDHQGGALTFEG